MLGLGLQMQISPMSEALSGLWQRLIARTDYETCTRPRAARFNLDEMKSLMSQLGHPEDAYSVFHVAGSKGKGSVSLFLERGLRSGGEKTGLYTSPHLSDWRERICVNGQPASDAALCHAMQQVLDASSGHETFFDLLTAVAFLVFQLEGCSAVVLETGLGGRSDSTNVVRQPKACIVTSIELEHTDVLGDDLESIAFEKAGIFKPSSELWVSSTIQSGIREVFANQARILDSTVIEAEPIQMPDGFSHPQDHMRANYSLAHAVLTSHFENESFAFSDFNLPGRYEKRLSENGMTIVFDTAHSEDSLKAVLKAFHEEYPHQRRGVLLALRDEKDLLELARSLADDLLGTEANPTQLFATRAGDHPRSADPKQLAHAFQATLLEEPTFPADVDVLLVTGSTYLVGALRPYTQAFPCP